MIFVLDQRVDTPTRFLGFSSFMTIFFIVKQHSSVEFFHASEILSCVVVGMWFYTLNNQLYQTILCQELLN